MKKIFITQLILLCYTIQLQSNNIRYSRQDSIKAIQMLEKIKKSGKTDTASLVLEAGMLFIGTPYASGTLDREKSERLTVNINETDCTTFVEQALALAITIKQGEKDFQSFCNNLRNIRYRDGICNGYASRLHYFTQWVENGEKKDIMQELDGKEFTGIQKLHLNFMSKNPEKYMQLKNNSFLIKSIAHEEKPFNSIDIKYIPKKRLKNGKDKLHIQDGDIIALVTNINGLDVTHMGIAVWKSNKLHMLHASYKEKKVILDKTPLYDYLLRQKQAPGIRAVRIK